MENIKGTAKEAFSKCMDNASWPKNVSAEPQGPNQVMIKSYDDGTQQLGIIATKEGKSVHIEGGTRNGDIADLTVTSSRLPPASDFDTPRDQKVLATTIQNAAACLKPGA
ncbi:MAG: hypothetical protein DI586_04935 [Micavibrio aeruginosavorus]|uniref:Uncharacterized protein n=1 Tax=Micavibrio aeruginosavorus TaxID=349221 RepID=A0A2W5FNT2_9BACT|nr:MAG: hypothetical protein DI586_04935 [Micavibrio aeruginosavorus]